MQINMADNITQEELEVIFDDANAPQENGTNSEMYFCEPIENYQKRVRYFNHVVEIISVTTEDNQLWILASPFAKLLFYTKANDAIELYVSKENKKIYKDIKSSRCIPTTVVIRHKSKFINCAGLFELIDASLMPNIHKFKRWIEYKLLPVINQIKDYSINHNIDENYSSKEIETLKQTILKKNTIIELQAQENRRLNKALQ
ncbi:baculovirus repeated ORF [Adoxophyes honmai nucleopolyhedrovirus]|uniref:Baculovirus repeated ORF n=1 Tax=Adoxophyes honmai nucleopolyhedrovirus TaxID=224399 RepID=Q80LK2_NPVAH|nr:baculovirus repeated ORF [Adoxophyes honmai nucleopolyhedrovirus]BAC67345.1 baculovirus repeated ORF [Adoxophyes honmai nucleopolyhedrovirus]